MKIKLNKLGLALLIFIFSTTGVYAQPDAAKNIVVSIKPIALMVNDLLGDRAKIRTLVQAGSSPHDFSLKVSDMTAISEADLLIWMGPELEHFLQKPLAQKNSKQILTLAETHKIKTKGQSEPSNHEHGNDPHLWLDPAQAREMATKIAQFLIEQSPGEAEFIQEQLERVSQDYSALANEIAKKLLPHQQTPFLVYHDGYRYLVEAFGLNQIAWITKTPEQAVGAKRLYELQQQIIAYDADIETENGGNSGRTKRPACLFIESTHQSSSVKNIAKRLELQAYPLDLLAADETITSYRQLMSAIASAMADCFAAN